MGSGTMDRRRRAVYLLPLLRVLFPTVSIPAGAPRPPSGPPLLRRLGLRVRNSYDFLRDILR